MGPVVITPSPFAVMGARLLDMGYSVIPIIPGEKRPGEVRNKVWRGMNDWQRFCERRATSFEMMIWNGFQDAGVCVALGPASGWLVAIDLDYGSPELRAAIEALLPPSPVRKKGAKGYTAFYRGSQAIQARVFRINNQSVCEVLARGRQTVLPPTIHPDGMPYEWITIQTLEDTPVADLPTLPDDIVQQIAVVLVQFGYHEKPETTAPAAVSIGPLPSDFDGEDTIWGEVNRAALAHLDAWVPALGLPKCRKSAPNHYEAVAHWRPSNSGRPLSERKPNLGIDGRGIRDFGDDRGYSPLTLIMSACGCTLDEAYAWLRDLVLPKQTTITLQPRAVELPPHDPETGEVLDEDPPGAQTPAPEAETDDEETSAAIIPAGFDGDPFSPAAAGGLIGMMATEFYRNDRRPIPEFMMASAISAASVLYGRRFVGPTGVGLNLYMIGLAQTGGGKNKPLNLSLGVLRAAGLGRLCGPEKVRSDAAIIKILRIRASFLMKIDEFGLFFQSVSGSRSANWERRILETLLDLYTASTTAWAGSETAADDQDRSQQPIHSPTVSLFGMSTLTEFYNALTERNLSDGFLNRLTMVQAFTTPRRRKAPALPTFSKELCEAIQAAAVSPQAGGNLAAANALNPHMAPTLIAVPWASDDVERYWESIEDWQLAAGDEDPILQGIVGRAAEQVQKLATLRALSRDQAAAVEQDDIAWAWAIISRSIEVLKEGVKTHMAGSEFERLHKTILEAIKVAGPFGLPRSLLLQKKGVSKAKPKDFEEAVQYLVQAELILPPKAGTGPKGGRPGIRFYLRDPPES